MSATVLKRLVVIVMAVVFLTAASAASVAPAWAAQSSHAEASASPTGPCSQMPMSKHEGQGSMPCKSMGADCMLLGCLGGLSMLENGPRFAVPIAYDRVSYLAFSVNRDGLTTKPDPLPPRSLA